MDTPINITDKLHRSTPHSCRSLTRATFHSNTRILFGSESHASSLRRHGPVDDKLKSVGRRMEIRTCGRISNPRHPIVLSRNRAKRGQIELRSGLLCMRDLRLLLLSPVEALMWECSRQSSYLGRLTWVASRIQGSAGRYSTRKPSPSHCTDAHRTWWLISAYGVEKISNLLATVAVPPTGIKARAGSPAISADLASICRQRHAAGT